ncbi:hypothetical protein JOD31_000213 [Methylopila capsulata]|uniref:Uncharacterized protein n=1 Tax=Methylopila capsulata TaxID=61654 RepID=A0A9W6IRR9_9HYPH|nr:hypothetical protein [Methylopila capsulata]MBM7850001.1 hypothetical protein [Methylopila capsulata]GLK55293.1 hypothetical protein GCM10008170_13120 [Methylopila capsulata]
MWTAISSVIALVLVAALNIGLLAAAGGELSPMAQVMTTALWALQAPVAAILVSARKKPEEGGVAVAPQIVTGESVAALVTVFSIGCFVAMQLGTFVFGGIVFLNDYLLASLCALGHADRCAQIAPDAAGSTYATILIGGGMFSILVGMIGFGVAGYRIGWRARRLGWLGAMLVPPIVIVLLFAENLVLLTFTSARDDSMLALLDPVTLALARAPLALAGLVTAGIGYGLSRRLNAPVRRYARSVAKASGRRPDPGALKSAFLAVLGFRPAEHELLVRRRQAPEAAPASLYNKS